MFSAARLVTGARCRASEAGVACGCSSVVRSTSPCVCTQTSALLPPRCIEAICASGPARRASPPGSTRHDCGPSLTANTRSISARGAMWPGPRSLAQVGICDSGR
ncbi:hypothetical protein D9M68_614730 [compost metagenome]